MLEEILEILNSKFKEVGNDLDLEWNRAIHEAISVIKQEQGEIPTSCSCEGCQCYGCSGYGCDTCWECKNYDNHSGSDRDSDWWCDIREEYEQ